MQVVDSLDAGGMERVAVNLANSAAEMGFESHLCTTRRDGALASEVHASVGRLRLDRKSRFDAAAFLAFARYVRTNRIRVIHAHGTALFVSAIAGASSFASLIWHDHYGAATRPRFVYGVFSRRAAHIFAVNRELVRWNVSLGVDPSKIQYLPNFTQLSPSEAPMSLPGVPGRRLVCVANFRPEKDHLTLLRAFRLVADAEKDARLFLAGSNRDAAQMELVHSEIHRLGLDDSVLVLGPTKDIPGLLAACDLGVLSSAFEGLPLALLEYGAAGLATVSTDVGECREVLDGGKAGILVPPKAAELLAAAILRVLREPELRHQLSSALRDRIRRAYDQNVAMQSVADVYRRLADRQSSANWEAGS